MSFIHSNLTFALSFVLCMNWLCNNQLNFQKYDSNLFWIDKCCKLLSSFCSGSRSRLPKWIILFHFRLRTCIINQQCYLNRITLIILHKINSYYYIHTMDNITIEIWHSGKRWILRETRLIIKSLPMYILFLIHFCSPENYWHHRAMKIKIVHKHS